jgi:hypothetical protein
VLPPGCAHAIAHKHPPGRPYTNGLFDTMPRGLVPLLMKASRLERIALRVEDRINSTNDSSALRVADPQIGDTPVSCRRDSRGAVLIGSAEAST